jgi:hypothetical protein
MNTIDSAPHYSLISDGALKHHWNVREFAWSKHDELFYNFIDYYDWVDTTLGIHKAETNNSSLKKDKKKTQPNWTVVIDTYLSADDFSNIIGASSYEWELIDTLKVIFDAYELWDKE